jgi:hypothetical protein
MANCKNCKHYTKWSILGIVSWCKQKDCYIARPKTFVCIKYMPKWYKRLMQRLLNVRKMM